MFIAEWRYPLYALKQGSESASVCGWLTRSIQLAGRGKSHAARISRLLSRRRGTNPTNATALPALPSSLAMRFARRSPCRTDCDDQLRGRARKQSFLPGRIAMILASTESTSSRQSRQIWCLSPFPSCGWATTGDRGNAPAVCLAGFARVRTIPLDRRPPHGTSKSIVDASVGKSTLVS